MHQANSESTSFDRPVDAPKFPPGIPYIVGNEGAERFSFYGMKAILKVYFIALLTQFVREADVAPEAMAQATARSTEVVHLFVAGVYAFPLLGAIIADRLLGKYHTILWVSLIYCAGHAVLAFAGRLGKLENYDAAEMSMYLGLSMIAVGSGGIKPCVSANVGDQFTAANSQLVTKVFQIFYFIINYGSFFSTIITPLLLRRYGGEVAFGVPGILMGVATIVFWMGRNRFIHVAPQPGGKLGLFDTVVTALLFSPLFSIILGYFVLWDSFLGAAQQKSELAGTTFPGVDSELIAQYFSHYWWLPVGTLLALAAGLALFRVRQRIQESTGFLGVMLYNFTHQGEREPGMGFFDVGRVRFGDEIGDGPPAVLKIVLLFSMVSIFWALFDQHASTWIDQARLMAMGLTVPACLGYWTLSASLGLSVFALVWLFCSIGNHPLPRAVTNAFLGLVVISGLAAGACDLWGPPLGDIASDANEIEMQARTMPIRERTIHIDMDPAQLSAFNSLFVMIIIPALNLLVYAPLARRGIVVKPLQKMTVGMFLAAVAFATAALLQEAIQTQGIGQVHGLWQVLQYFIMTVAEVLVSITGLEFAYTQAPRAMKSTMMGFWLLCVTMGNLLVAFLAPLEKKFELSQFFWLFAGLMLVAAAIFLVMALLYRGKSYLQPSGGVE